MVLVRQQVCWTLAAPLELCEQQGVSYDAAGRSGSTQRKRVSSYQNTDEEQDIDILVHQVIQVFHIFI